ncbi:MAG: flagellar basal body-associated FliL family protein [Steroidobacteraceae bacterium]|jgi:flagellar FliL protein
MADKKDDKKKAPDAAAPAGEEGAPTKKSKLMFFVMIAAGALGLIGISVGATLYLTGFFNPPPATAKAGEEGAAEEGEAGAAAEEGAEGSDTAGGGEPKPDAKIPEGEKFAATYKPVTGSNGEERDFTLNVPNTRRFVQFKVAYKTFYGEKIVERVTKHQIAIGAAIISTAAQFGEEEMVSVEGRARLAAALRDSMNDVLIRNEDFGGIDEVMFTHFVFQ